MKAKVHFRLHVTWYSKPPRGTERQYSYPVTAFVDAETLEEFKEKGLASFHLNPPEGVANELEFISIEPDTNPFDFWYSSSASKESQPTTLWDDYFMEEELQTCDFCSEPAVCRTQTKLGYQASLCQMHRTLYGA